MKINNKVKNVKAKGRERTPRIIQVQSRRRKFIPKI